VNNAQANLAPIPAGSTDEQACCCADMLSTGIMGASMPTSRAAGPWRSLPRDRSGRWPRWGRGSWGLGWWSLSRPSPIEMGRGGPEAADQPPLPVPRGGGISRDADRRRQCAEAAPPLRDKHTPGRE